MWNEKPTETRSIILAPEPRNIPISVWAGLLFSGTIPFIGWFFFGLGMFFALGFRLPQTVASWYWFQSPPQVTRGVVTSNRRTAYSENRSRVFETAFSYTAEDGAVRQGRSFATGTSRRRGEVVAIEYPAGHPEHARIQGMREAPFSPVVAVILIFPVVGLALIAGAFFAGLKGARLLANGKLAFGVLKSKHSTGSRVNGRMVYKLTFEFTSEDGQLCQVVSRTHRPEILEDEAKEPLLYDPLRPTYAAMLDTLPGSPQFDVTGEILPVGDLLFFARLLLPALVVGGLSYYAYLSR